MEQQGKELVKTVEDIIAEVKEYDEAAKVNTNSPPGLSRVRSREIISFWGGWEPPEFQYSQVARQVYRAPADIVFFSLDSTSLGPQ